jgi:predicted RNase H-like nuclease
MRAVGVDGCRGGWVAVGLADGRFEEPRVFRTFAEVLEEYDDAGAIGVDIPIGCPLQGSREADEAARAFLPPARRRSVFPTPPRETLLAPTYAAARSLHPWLSTQSFALRQRILEVEGLADQRVYEVHPEVSFFARAGRLLPSKHTTEGIVEREAVLGIRGDTDALDAAAAAWSADRIVRGRARTLPGTPSLDPVSGRPVAIWY